MTRRATPLTLVPALAILALTQIAAAAADGGGFAALANRLPAETDAVVAVNVEKLRASPVAAREKWAEPTAQAWAESPVMAPPGAKRVLAGAAMQAGEMEPAWLVCLTELDEQPSLEALVDAEAGYMDRLWNKDAVCSPVNAYFIPLDKTVFASVTPADRRATVRWLRQPEAKKPGVTSAYITGVLETLSDATDVVMAMDLENAVGVPEIRRRIAEADEPALKSQDPDALARVLGSVVGVTLNVRAGERLMGNAVVKFGEDPANLEKVAKPLVSAILRNNGMHLNDLDKWTYTVSGRELKMEGELSTAGLRNLFSLVQSPIPAASVPALAQTAAASSEAIPAAAKTPGATAGGKPVDPAQASLRYYKSVANVLDSFSPSASTSDTAVWFRRASKRIDQLPILGVDPALVEWGSGVSSKLKQVAGIGAVGQTQISARVAGIRGGDSGYVGGYSDRQTATVNAEQRAHNQAVAQQARQAALEQKAQTQQQAARSLEEMAGSREAIRAQMVQKYGIEF